MAIYLINRVADKTRSRNWLGIPITKSLKPVGVFTLFSPTNIGSSSNRVDDPPIPHYQNPKNQSLPKLFFRDIL